MCFVLRGREYNQKLKVFLNKNIFVNWEITYIHICIFTYKHMNGCMYDVHMYVCTLCSFEIFFQKQFNIYFYLTGFYLRESLVLLCTVG